MAECYNDEQMYQESEHAFMVQWASNGQSAVAAEIKSQGFQQLVKASIVPKEYKVPCPGCKSPTTSDYTGKTKDRVWLK